MATAERVTTNEQRFLLHGLDWQAYELLGEALLNRHIRITYDRGDLEMMTVSNECYYILNESRVRFKDELDLDVDPPPDLALEVKVSRSALDRVAIYAALGVPELWRYDGRKLIICLLKEGVYVEQERSMNLPQLEPAVILRFVKLRETLHETACIRAFREWIAETFPEAR